MPATSKGLRYPASSAAPNVPQDIQNLANDANFWLPDSWVSIADNDGYSYTPTASWAEITGMTGSVTVPAGRTLTVQFRAPAVNVTGGIIQVRLLVNGTARDGAVYSIGSGTVWIPARHEWSIVGTGAAVTFSAQAVLASGTGTIQGGGVGNVVFRYRIA